MGARAHYAPGTFCWVELETRDLDGAMRFYAGLFGWRIDDGRVARLGSDRIAGMRRGAGERWHSHVSVEDAAATASRAVALGAGSADGRAIVDPQGARICLREPRESIGATRVNDPGCLVWNELTTTDPAAATAFYCDLFGWRAEGGYRGPDGPYTMLRVGDRLNAGVNDAPGDVAAWLPYFAVASVDGTLARAVESGATVAAPPVTTDIDRFTVLRDPNGAAFAVVEGEVDP